MKLEQDKEMTFWLFADMLIKDSMFVISDVVENYKTKKGSELPVFIFTGKANGKDNAGKTVELVGDFVAARWNLKLNECIEKWGTDSKEFLGKSVILEADGSKMLVRPQ